MAKMTQCEMVLEYMQEHGGITQLDALQFGCMRLASRVSDLKKAGFPIVRETATAKNRYGENVSFARYRLEVPEC